MVQPFELTVTQAASEIRAGRLSPVELLQSLLDRIDALEPSLQAWATLVPEQALEAARRAEQEMRSYGSRSIMHGIPFGAKDLLATSEGIPTTWGAIPYRDQTFDYDATVLQKLEESGAVLTAKLAMVELAGGMGYRQPNASITGPGINPWNKDAWSGGSSSGSGSSVAAGLVPFAIGSETFGSILSPAGNCGVAGLRPTYGRVSRYGAMALSWTLDKLGPLCLTADDCGLVLNTIAGYDPNDPSTTKRPYQYEASDLLGQRFRLGVIKGVADGADEEVQANFRESLRVLEQVASIDEVEMLEGFPSGEVTRTILNAEAASAFEDFLETGRASELTAPEDRYGGYARMSLLATDYIRALRLRGLMAREADRVMSHYDVLVAPSRATVASALDEEFRSVAGGGAPDVMGAVGNGAGLPAISVPNGFGARGLPTGIQFMGRVYEENRVLAVARAYQSLTDWHQRHPPEALPKN